MMRHALHYAFWPDVFLMHHLWSWILELTGTQSSSSKAYNFWSGFGGDIAILGSVLAAPFLLWRKHDCGIRWCWRLGRHEYKDPVTGIVHSLCRKHHPDHPGRKPVRWREFCERHALYLGEHPGKG
jgi:hypothetical protein